MQKEEDKHRVLCGILGHQFSKKGEEPINGSPSVVQEYEKCDFCGFKKKLPYITITQSVLNLSKVLQEVIDSLRSSGGSIEILG